MKKIIILLFLLLTTTMQLNAEEIQLYNDELTYFVGGETICANRVYYYDNSTNYKEIVIKDAETNVILEVYNANSATLELVFPENAGNIEIVVTDYDENGKLDLTTETSTSFTVEPCGYTEIKTNYNQKIPYATFDVSDNIITVTPPTDVSNYAFTYKFVDQENAREADAAEPITIELGENTVLQFTETYTNSEGKEVTNYYELEINPTTNDYFIRNVDSFSINTIDVKSLINVKYLVVMLIFLFLLIFFITKHKRLKKKIKKKKESRR